MENKSKKGLSTGFTGRWEAQEKTTDSIIPNNKIMGKVESLLGEEVDPKLYKKALKYARHKLKWQSERYGRKYDTHYLAIVISEVYTQQAITEEMVKTGMKIGEMTNEWK